MREVTINSLKTFSSDFGEIGLKVAPRVGPRKRTKSEKEWYVLRRFLQERDIAIRFGCPLHIREGVPPLETDFVLRVGQTTFFCEITEATLEADQREMTEVAKSSEAAILNGEFGGRYSGVAAGDRPERDFVADIFRAIRRKRAKSVFSGRRPESHLVIYVNSNAGSLANEDDAYQVLFRRLNEFGGRVRDMTKGGFVHVVGNRFICVDILDERNLVRRASDLWSE